MASTQELIFKISADGKAVKSELSQIRSELTKTAQAQKTTNQGELSMRQQLAAAASLQRQRSAALIGEWKRSETAAANLAKGVKPVADNLQRVTDIMQTLGASSSALQGPLNGVSGRLTAIGSLASGAGGGLGVMGAAIAGAIVVAAAAVVGFGLLGKTFYDLTKSTAEFEGKFFDLAQKTGFTTETLSTLAVAFKTTGGDIDSGSASLVIFEKNMEKARMGQEGMSKTFRQLNIDTVDNEKALRQAFTALIQIPEGARQTATALNLFGRSGKDVLAVIKETNGNLDEATAKYSKMGLVVSSEAAAAADRFNDSLAILEEQLAGVGRMLTEQSIPVFITFFEDISQGLTGSKDAWGDWSRFVAAEVAVVLGSIEGLVLYIKSAGNISLGTAIDASIDSIIQRTNQTTAALMAQGAAERAARLVSGGGSGGGGGKGKKSKDEVLAAAMKDAALTEKETLQLIAENVTENRRALQEQIRDIEDFTERAKALSLDRYNATIDRANAELLALDIALKKKSIKQQEFDEKFREQDIEIRDAKQKHSEEVFNLDRDRDRKKSEAELAARRRADQIAEEADERQIARITDRIDRGVLLESEGEKQIAAILAQGFARRKESLEKEDQAYATSLERQKAIKDEIVLLDGKRAKSAEDAAARILKAQFDEQNKPAKDATRARRTTSGVDSIASTDAFDVFGKAISEHLSGDKLIAAQAGLMALSSAFQQVGQAVGDAVHAFVLFGGAGIGIKKFTATLIAEIARMAAVQAIWELAQGVAMLAMNFFWPDPRLAEAAAFHFHAAAIYGSLAVLSAGVGRAVSGNGFNQTGSGGGASRPSGSQSSPSSEPKPVEVDRRSGFGVVTAGGLSSGDIVKAIKDGLGGMSLNPTFKIAMHGEAGEAFKYKVISVVIEDHRLNGPIRDLTENGTS
jgi:hypothetical protein